MAPASAASTRESRRSQPPITTRPNSARPIRRFTHGTKNGAINIHAGRRTREATSSNNAVAPKICVMLI